jgi:hypothetical protein
VSDRVTIISTTDNQAAVDEAAIAVEGDTLIPAEEQGYESPIATAEVGSRGSVASSTDSQAEVERVAIEANEEKEDRAETEGRTRRQLRRTVARLTEEVSKWRKEFGTHSQPAQPQNGEVTEQRAEQPAVEPQNGEAQTDDLRRQQQAWEAQRLQGEATLPYRLREAEARYPDLQETFASVDLPDWVVEALRVHEDGMDVGYYIGKHPDLARQMVEANRRGEHQQITRTLDWISNGLRFREQFDPAPRERQRPSHRAPSPIEPVRGGSSRSAVPLDQADYREYKRRRDSGEGR